MKKKLLAILTCAMAACLGLFALTACGGSNDSADESADIDTLIVGFDAAYPPYGYLADDDEEGYEASNGNTYTGFNLDLAAKVCEANGWALQVEPIDWDSKDALLGNGTINCIWNGFTYEGREDNYSFSAPYMVNAQVVVVRADSDIKTLEDLADKNVITQADSSALNVLEGDQADLAATFAGGKVSTISDYNNAFMQLESGAVDAVACDLSIAAYQMAANPDKYVQLEETLFSEHYAVGFALGSDALAEKVTETLKQLDADGEIEALCEKYADQGMDYANWCLE